MLFSSSANALMEELHPCDTASDFHDLTWKTERPLNYEIEFLEVPTKTLMGNVPPVSEIYPSCYVVLNGVSIGPFLIENGKGVLEEGWSTFLSPTNGYLVGSQVKCWLFDKPAEQAKIKVRFYQEN